MEKDKKNTPEKEEDNLDDMITLEDDIAENIGKALEELPEKIDKKKEEK